MPSTVINIEVAYALPEKQHLLALQFSSGVTAREAVLKSPLQNVYPELDLAHCPIGIFGHEVADDHRLRDGDRVEIYRPLNNDPREQRRALAKKGEVMGRAAKP